MPRTIVTETSRDKRSGQAKKLSGKAELQVSRNRVETCPAPECNLTTKEVKLFLNESKKYMNLFKPAFARVEQVQKSVTYLHGLLGNSARKNVEQMALGQKEKVRSLQYFVGQSQWETEPVIAIHEGLLHGVQTGQLSMEELQASVERISRLKQWLSDNSSTHDLSVIRSIEHMKIADEIAERSITLVRDRNNYLPIKLESDQRIAVIVPVPQDLTPADTSSYVQPKLADSVRKYHARTDEFAIPYSPSENEIASILQRVGEYDVIIVGTINAYAEKNQASFVHELLKMDKPVIIVAMRLPYDLSAFPQASTFVCTYSILEPSMKAVAKALFGRGEMKGQLPVSIPSSNEAG